MPSLRTRAALPVAKGKGSSTTTRKKPGKPLKVYGMKSDGQVGVVGTTEGSKKK